MSAGKGWVLFLGALCLIIAVATSGFAAGKASGSAGTDDIKLPETLSEEQIDDFLARMSDEQVRRLLLDQLKESARLEAANAHAAADPVNSRLDLFNQRLRQVLAAGRNELGPALVRAYGRLSGDGGFGAFLVVLLKTAVLLFVSFLGEWLVRRKQTVVTKNFESLIAAKGPHRYRGAILKGVQGVIGLLVFFLVAFLMFQILYDKRNDGRFVAYTVFMAIFLVRISVLVLDLIFSPRNESVRLAGLNHESAVLIHHWSLAALTMGAVVLYFSKLLVLLGGSPELGLFFRCAIGPLVALPLIIMAVQHGKMMMARMKTEVVSEKIVRRIQFGWLFHVLFILYVFVGWGVSQFTMMLSGQGTMWRFLLSFVAIPIFIALDRIGHRVLGRAMRPKPDQGQPAGEGAPDEPGPESEAAPPAKLASRGLRFFLIILLLAALIRFWNINLPWSEQLSKATFSVLITMFLAHLAWEYTKAAIERRLGGKPEGASGDPEDGGGAPVPGRLHTLLPLLRKFIGVVLVVTAALIVLSSMGVEIAPLLASAGIFGLAIGLGAQTLVKDIMAGIFFLVDDAFRVGDYVSMGSVEGFVEKISLRTVTMRHAKGQVEIIPYGDIKTVTNFNRGPIMVKFNLFVPVDTDVKQVKKIVKKINQQISEDPDLGPHLVDPVKSQGVKSIEDGVMTIRIKFRAQPGTQFLIKRQAFQEIQKAFKKAGIQWASRGVAIIAPPAPAETAPASAESPPPANTAPTPPPAGNTADPVQMGAAAAALLDSAQGGKKKK